MQSQKTWPGEDETGAKLESKKGSWCVNCLQGYRKGKRFKGQGSCMAAWLRSEKNENTVEATEHSVRGNRFKMKYQGETTSNTMGKGWCISMPTLKQTWLPRRLTTQETKDLIQSPCETLGQHLKSKRASVTEISVCQGHTARVTYTKAYCCNIPTIQTHWSHQTGEWWERWQEV